MFKFMLKPVRIISSFLQILDWVCPQLSVSLCIYSRRSKNPYQTVCNVSLIPREKNGCAYLRLAWCMIFRCFSVNFYYFLLFLWVGIWKEGFMISTDENREFLTWPTSTDTNRAMMMVDPSSHLFMCQGKQVLPLPFSFDLETSLLFYFQNCLISDIVFWMPVLETVQMHRRC